MTNLKDFLFENTENGEEFFVECYTLNEAWAIIDREFKGYYEREFIEYEDVWVTPSEAEIWGLDTL